MNRLQSLFFMLLLCTTCIAQKFSIKDAAGCEYSFRVSSKADKEVVLVSASNKKGPKLEIPGKVTNKGVEYKVVRVQTQALKDCDPELRVLTFPNTVTEIEGYLFGSSMKLMGGYAGVLKGGKSDRPMSTITLESLRIPESLTDIGYYAFATSMSTSGAKGLKAHIDELPKQIVPLMADMYGLKKSDVTDYWQKHDPQMLTNEAASAVISGQMNPLNAQVAALTSSVPSPTPVLQLNSDVDKDLPQAQKESPNTFVIIFANEHYQEEVPVEYAANDGAVFKMYCKQVLGIPEENIHLRQDATLNNMLAELEWISQVAKAFSGQAHIIMYYAGHGIPDEATGAAYLLPVDGMGRNLKTGYSLTSLYKLLGELPAKNITLFMDACFSGAQRGNGMLASARGVAIKTKPQTPQGNLVVLSAAQGDETAYPYKEKQHGLFTYFLLKKLQETAGNCTIEELGDYIKAQVSRRSIIVNQKSQTPSISVSTSLSDSWKSFKLRN